MVVDEKKATSSILAGFDKMSKEIMSKGLIFSENWETKWFADSEAGNGKVIGLRKELRA